MLTAVSPPVARVLRLGERINVATPVATLSSLIKERNISGKRKQLTGY